MKRILIDGNTFSTKDEFYTEMERLLTRNLDWKTGHNLDAFADLLRGGFGFHEYGEKIEAFWNNSEKSKNDLGEDFFNIVLEIMNDDDSNCELKLIDLKMTKTELQREAGFSRSTLAKMGKDEYIALEVVEKICNALNCEIGDIVEFTNPSEE